MKVERTKIKEDLSHVLNKKLQRAMNNDINMKLLSFVLNFDTSATRLLFYGLVYIIYQLNAVFVLDVFIELRFFVFLPAGTCCSAKGLILVQQLVFLFLFATLSVTQLPSTRIESPSVHIRMTSLNCHFLGFPNPF